MILFLCLQDICNVFTLSENQKSKIEINPAVNSIRK